MTSLKDKNNLNPAFSCGKIAFFNYHLRKFPISMEMIGLNVQNISKIYIPVSYLRNTSLYGHLFFFYFRYTLTSFYSILVTAMT